MVDDGATGPPKMPLWVKVFLALGVLVIVVLAVVAVAGGGEHGPGRHFGGDHESSSHPTHTGSSMHHGDVATTDVSGDPGSTD